MRMFLLTALTVFSIEALAGGLFLTDEKSDKRKTVTNINMTLSGDTAVLTLGTGKEAEKCIVSAPSSSSGIALYNTLNAAIEKRDLDNGITTIVKCDRYNAIVIQNIVESAKAK